MKTYNSPSLALQKTTDEAIAVAAKFGSIEQTTPPQLLSSEMMDCLISAKAVPIMVPKPTVFGDEDQNSEISMQDWGWGWII